MSVVSNYLLDRSTGTLNTLPLTQTYKPTFDKLLGFLVIKLGVLSSRKKSRRTGSDRKIRNLARNQNEKILCQYLIRDHRGQSFNEISTLA